LLIDLVFCMERVMTSIFRIASVSKPHDLRLAIGAQIFVAAGVLILFVINLIFAMRIVRSTHRSFGWHPAFDISFKVICVLIAGTLIAVISGTVQSFYTLDPHTRATDRALQLYGSTFLAIMATLPLPMLALTLLIPYSPLDQLGTGRMRTKVIILLSSTILLSLGAWYRCGAAWQNPTPRSQPLPGYLGKAAFYIFNFLVEIQTVLMYAILRVDQRFHIPNGAHGPGSYSRPPQLAGVELRDSRPTSSADEASGKLSTVIEDDLDDAKSEIDIEKDQPPLPNPQALQIPQSRSHSHSPSRPTSLHPTPSRPTSSRPTSLFQHVLNKSTKSFSEQKHTSVDSSIIRRLGGPWAPLSSPTESVFSSQKSPTHSTSSAEGNITPWAGLSRETSAPSIRDTLREQGDWTPEIDWELASPKRFLSLKKRSMSLLR
jgi:uncharacterized integral membrane protein